MRQEYSFTIGKKQMRNKVNLLEWVILDTAYMKWEKSLVGWLKVNVDASLDMNQRKMGIGYVIRDYEGKFVASKEIPLQDVYLAKEAEAIGVREVLKWIKTLGYDQAKYKIK